MRPSRRILLLSLATVLTVVAIAVALAFRSAQGALSRSVRQAGTRHELRFSLHTLEASSSQAGNPGFEPVEAAPSFTSGVFAGEELYLAGPAGLSIYAADGSLRQTLRTGIELPVAPITALVAARLRGDTDPHLLLATSGAGLLWLVPHGREAPTLRQLLPDSAEARDLTALLPLPSGELLLGTRHAGVLLYNGSTLVPAIPGNQVRQVSALAAVDSASYLIGTRDAGVFYLHAGTLQHADIAAGLPDDQVDALAVVQGRAFAGTPLGTAELALGSGSFKPARTLAPGLFAHALTVAGGELVIGTLDQGVQPVALEERAHLRHAAFSPSSQRIEQFLPALHGDGLYAIADGQLVARTSTGWHAALPGNRAGLSDRNISALAFAPDGSLYVGFFDRGLDIVPSTAGVPIRHFEDDHLFCINRLVLDPQRQTMAAATANGLVLFDRQGSPRQTLTRRDGLISDHITDIAFTRNGTTLATPAGLTFLTSAGAESLYAFQGLVNNHVYTLGRGTTLGGSASGASAETLLAGTLGGISWLSGNSVARNFTVANSTLSHNWITALAPNPGGGWLVGTYGGGLLTLSADGARFTAVDLPAGTPRDLVINPNALLVTTAHIFAGTLTEGMLVFDISSGRWSAVTNGLPSHNVTAFAEREGELFVGTENGLVRIAESKLGGAR